MSYDSSRYASSQAGVGYEGPRDAFNPRADPELFRGVLTARVMAVIIDVIVIAVPVVLATIFISIFGLVTLGLGWLLFWPLSGAATVWAVLYYGLTLGGRHSATIGMRTMGIEMRTLSGAPAYFVLGAVHAILYWVSVSMLTPFIVLIGLFNARGRLLHDFILGAVVINGPARAARFTYRR